ncbi:MAG: TonB family protein [Novosphingobium sp.]
MSDTRSRALALAAAAALHIVAILGLVEAFGVRVVVERIRTVAAFAVPLPPTPPPEPPPPPKPPRAMPEPPPAPRVRAPPPLPEPLAKARQLAPQPPRPLAQRATSPAPPLPEAGRQGAASGPVAGGGSGAGAEPDLDRDSRAIVRRAEKIAGELHAHDFPRAGADERDGRFVIVRFDVGPDGRVANCRTAQSSGSAEVDGLTCRLIERRFRYRPARDGAGRAVSDVTGWKQWWWQ